MPFEYEALRDQAQQTLIDFLTAELALGSSFMLAASLSFNEGHITHYEQAKNGATKTADTVLRFLSAVTDSKVRADIDMRLGALYRLISSL